MQKRLSLESNNKRLSISTLHRMKGLKLIDTPEHRASLESQRRRSSVRLSGAGGDRCHHQKGGVPTHEATPSRGQSCKKGVQFNVSIKQVATPIRAVTQTPVKEMSMRYELEFSKELPWIFTVDRDFEQFHSDIF